MLETMKRLDAHANALLLTGASDIDLLGGMFDVMPDFKALLDAGAGPSLAWLPLGLHLEDSVAEHESALGRLVDRRPGLGDERPPQEEVLGRVAAQRQLGRHEQINPSRMRRARLGNDAVCVARQVTDDDVDLGQGNLQGRGHGREQFRTGNQHCHSGRR